MFRNKQKITILNEVYWTPRRCGPFFLFQAGECLCSESTVIHTHPQLYFEMTYAVNGSGLCYAGDMETRISEGECFLSFPNETHMIRSDDKAPLHFIFLAFFAEPNTEEARYIEQIRENFYSIKKRRIYAKELMPLLLQILSEVKRDDEYTAHMIHLCITEILIKCLRKTKKESTSAAAPRYTDAELLTKDIIAYVAENAAEISSVESLSGIFYRSAQMLSKIFRAQTGLPIGKYINEKRMKLAADMLSEGESVTTVSEKLGYSSIHSFSRAYKAYYSISPSKKRNK